MAMTGTGLEGAHDQSVVIVRVLNSSPNMTISASITVSAPPAVKSSTKPSRCYAMVLQSGPGGYLYNTVESPNLVEPAHTECTALSAGKQSFSALSFTMMQFEFVQAPKPMSAANMVGHGGLAAHMGQNMMEQMEEKMFAQINKHVQFQGNGKHETYSQSLADLQQAFQPTPPPPPSTAPTKYPTYPTPPPTAPTYVPTATPTLRPTKDKLERGPALLDPKGDGLPTPLPNPFPAGSADAKWWSQQRGYTVSWPTPPPTYMRLNAKEVQRLIGKKYFSNEGFGKIAASDGTINRKQYDMLLDRLKDKIDEALGKKEPAPTPPPPMAQPHKLPPMPADMAANMPADMPPSMVKAMKDGGYGMTSDEMRSIEQWKQQVTERAENDFPLPPGIAAPGADGNDGGGAAGIDAKNLPPGVSVPPGFDPKNLPPGIGPDVGVPPGFDGKAPPDLPPGVKLPPCADPECQGAPAGTGGNGDGDANYVAVNGQGPYPGFDGIPPSGDNGKGGPPPKNGQDDNMVDIENTGSTMVPPGKPNFNELRKRLAGNPDLESILAKVKQKFGNMNEGEGNINEGEGNAAPVTKGLRSYSRGSSFGRGRGSPPAPSPQTLDFGYHGSHAFPGRGRPAPSPNW